MISKTRVQELLDYATNYGDFDENTPLGALDPADPQCINAFGRRCNIILLKKVLGILPDHYQHPDLYGIKETAHPEYTKVTALLREVDEGE